MKDRISLVILLGILVIIVVMGIAIYHSVASDNLDVKATPVMRSASPQTNLISVTDLNQGGLASGIYYLQAYVIKTYSCPACSPGAQCQPCMANHIVISQDDKPLVNYTALTNKEFVLYVKDPSPFVVGKKYDFTISIASGGLVDATRDVNLKSYRLVK